LGGMMLDPCGGRGSGVKTGVESLVEERSPK
jgi:hypothetical protein